MPNRILRDWTESDKINDISVHAERFITRLIMKADDYGCYHANTKLLKAGLFPLKDDVREADILRWRDECQKAGLIVVYESSNKVYLMIIDFRQRLRSMKGKFPLPNGFHPDNKEDSGNWQTHDRQLTVTRPPLADNCRLEVEVETEVEEKVNGKETPSPFVVKGKFFRSEDVENPPEVKLGGYQQMVKISKGRLLSYEELLQLFDVFKDQNLTGAKYYKDSNEVYSHFMNWLQKKDFKTLPQAEASGKETIGQLIKKINGK